MFSDEIRDIGEIGHTDFDRYLSEMGLVGGE